MPARTEHAPGTPSWVDLQTSDTAAAKSFYSALYGWEFEDLPVGNDADGNPAFYSMARKNGKDVAAVAGLPMPGIPPHWNTYVTVSDVDATAAQVAGAGGTVIMDAFDVMDAGRMAVVADPTGAMINLWTPKNSIGAQLVNEHGTLSWNELMSPDVAAARENPALRMISTAAAGLSQAPRPASEAILRRMPTTPSAMTKWTSWGWNSPMFGIAVFPY